MKKTVFLQAAFLALVPTIVCAQQAQDPQSTPAPATQSSPSADTGKPLTKDELKAQRSQQKKEEKAAKANAKAAKANAKAKEAQDKALQQQEKAGQAQHNAEPATPAPQQ